MAAIDKTYISSVEQYIEIRDWCLNQPIQYDSLGNTWHISDFLPYNCTYDDNFNIIEEHIYTEEEIKNLLNIKRKSTQKHKTKEDYNINQVEIPLWNTPLYVDIYLIRNCPIEFIQDRLKIQYSDCYESIKNYTSIYDAPQKSPAKIIRLVKKPNFNLRLKTRWFISVNSEHNYYSYNEKHNKFVADTELCNSDSSHKLYFGNMSIRKAIRWIRHWNLPSDVTITFSGKYVGQDYTFVTK